MRSLTIFFALFLSGLCCADGIVLPDGPLERDHPIPVTLETAIPDGAQRMGPGWVLPEGVNSYEVNKQLIVIAARPGTYKIGYKIVWIHVEPIALFDASGKEVTVLQFLACGDYDTTATLKIVGDEPEPEPEPEPDPTPAGPWDVMFFYDATRLDNLPQGQRTIISGRSTREAMEAGGHVLLEVLDKGVFSSGSLPERYRPWVEAARQYTVPTVAVAPKGKVDLKASDIKVYALPTTPADLIKYLNGYKKR